MARRSINKAHHKSTTPLWLVSFADIVTLMLCFLVMLVSLSVIDERSRKEVLGSVGATFGKGGSSGSSHHIDGQKSYSPSDEFTTDFALLRKMLLEDIGEEINFQENWYVQIISLNDTMLFNPGQTTLSLRGVKSLDRLLPYLQTIKHPLLVAGHTAPRQDEEGLEYKAAVDDVLLDSTWMISFKRAQAVYLHLQQRGVPSSLLSLEAFGEYRPLHSNDTPEGRKKNRRVDLILDKRNVAAINAINNLHVPLPPANTMYYKGFKFELNLPGTPSVPLRSSEEE